MSAELTTPTTGALNGAPTTSTLPNFIRNHHYHITYAGQIKKKGQLGQRNGSAGCAGYSCRSIARIACSTSSYRLCSFLGLNFIGCISPVLILWLCSSTG